MSERKHIKLECQKVFGDMVAFRIVEQTHIDTAFGDEDKRNEFIASNGISLKSYESPEFCGAIPNVLFLRGRASGRDNTILFAPSSDFLKIATAVREYNKHFAGEETSVVTDTGTFFVE